MMKITIICFGFNEKVTRSQPWHMADGLASTLSNNGHDVVLITDGVTPPVRDYLISKINNLYERNKPSVELNKQLNRTKPDVTFVFIGSHELLKPNRFKLAGNVELVICNARFKWKELKRISISHFINESHLLGKAMIGSLIPGWLLKLGYRMTNAKNILYVSKEAQTRYSAIGLPVGKLLLPSIDDCYQPVIKDHVVSKNITVCYFGPPLMLRGGLLAVKAFDQLAKDDSTVRLKLLIRIKDEPYMQKKVKEIEQSISQSDYKNRIDLIKKYLSPLELKNELDSSSIFLLPFLLTVSDSPLVVIEAGLTGKPVVCLKTPGVTEYVQELNGICVEQPEDLGLGLKQAVDLLNNPSRKNVKRWPSWDERVEGIVKGEREL